MAWQTMRATHRSIRISGDADVREEFIVAKFGKSAEVDFTVARDPCQTWRVPVLLHYQVIRHGIVSRLMLTGRKQTLTLCVLR
jgi:hypothetical protein